MKENLSYLVFVMDRSGSMSSMESQAVEGLNEFVRQQRQQPGHARMSLVQFNSHVNIVFEDVALDQVEEIQTINPSGNTALDDAIGSSIDRVGKILAERPEEGRPSKVIFAIMTDGEENSSRNYSTQQIKEMIRHQSEKYSWEFLFLGASLSTREQAKERGIQLHDVIQFNSDNVKERILCSSARVSEKRSVPKFLEGR